MLFRIDFEIGIYPDRIQISDRRSGRFVDFAAEMPFSAPGKLVHDAVYFENALAKAIRKAMRGGFILYDAQADVAGGHTLTPATVPRSGARCATSGLTGCGKRRLP